MQIYRSLDAACAVLVHGRTDSVMEHHTARTSSLLTPQLSWDEWHAELPADIEFVLTREAADELDVDEQGMICLDDVNHDIRPPDDLWADGIVFALRLVRREQCDEGVRIFAEVLEVL